jgi:hypothetical protein
MQNINNNTNYYFFGKDANFLLAFYGANLPSNIQEIDS